MTTKTTGQPGDLVMGGVTEWVLVPREPTEAMICDGFESEPDECFSPAEVWQQYEALSGCQQAAHRARLCYAAMIQAAPTPPAEAQVVGGRQPMTDAEVRQWIGACNHEPARQVLRDYLQLRALSAQPRPDDLRGRLQRQCSEWGAYWRAPDSHGVELTVEQATELLEDAVNVEVEIKSEAQPASAPVGVCQSLKLATAEEQAEAWQAVCELLTEIRPGWAVQPKLGVDCALGTIRAIAQQPAAHDAGTALRSIYDLLGVNTESDAGAEIARLHIIEAKSKKPEAADEAWREGWAHAYSGGKLYGDDGELQDNSTAPSIDWMRDSAEEIRRKITERGMRALRGAQPQGADHEDA